IDAYAPPLARHAPHPAPVTSAQECQHGRSHRGKTSVYGHSRCRSSLESSERGHRKPQRSYFPHSSAPALPVLSAAILQGAFLEEKNHLLQFLHPRLSTRRSPDTPQLPSLLRSHRTHHRGIAASPLVRQTQPPRTCTDPPQNTLALRAKR